MTGDSPWRISVFNAKISYTFYILHFPVVVLLQYAFWLMNMNHIAGFLLTVVIAYPLTFGLCCVVDVMKRSVKKSNLKKNVGNESNQDNQED